MTMVQNPAGDWEPRCDVCGVPYALTVTVAKQETTIYCSGCAGLVDAGLIRPETVCGVLRWRQWHFGEWTPGDLLPLPSAEASG